MTERKNQIEKVKSKNIYFYMTIPVAIVGFVFLTIQIATAGSELSVLETKKSELVKENQTITREIVKSSSLTKISERADELGYIKPVDTYFVKATDVYAKLP